MGWRLSVEVQICRLKRNLPKFSDLANETEGREKGKREAVRTKKVVHESTHVGTEGNHGSKCAMSCLSAELEPWNYRRL